MLIEFCYSTLKHVSAQQQHKIHICELYLPVLLRNSEESLLDEDRTPPGKSTGTEGDTGECQGGDQEGLVLTQANKVLLYIRVNMEEFIR